MNEKRKNKLKYISTGTNVNRHDLQWEELLEITELLMREAKQYRMYDLLTRLEFLRRSINSNKANKKLVRVTQTKIEKMQNELANELQKRGEKTR